MAIVFLRSRAPPAPVNHAPETRSAQSGHARGVRHPRNAPPAGQAPQQDEHPRVAMVGEAMAIPIISPESPD